MIQKILVRLSLVGLFIFASLPTHAQPAVDLEAETAKKILGQMSQAEYRLYIEVLAGGRPVPGLAEDVVLTHRATTPEIQYARDLIINHMAAYGVSDVVAEDFHHEIERRNLLVEIPGSSRPNEIVIVSAHYDSIGDWGAGANDNASGSAAVLQILAAFKRAGFKPERTIRFILYDAHERGLIGSKLHFKGVVARNEQVVLHLTMDMIGNSPEGVRSLLYDSNGYGDRIGDVIRAANRASALDFRVEAWGPFTSDNRASAPLGVPTVAVSENAVDRRGRELPYHPQNHSENDSLAYMNVEHAADVSKIVALTIAAVAQSTATFDERVALARQSTDQLRRSIRDKPVARKAIRAAGSAAACGGSGGAVFGAF